MCGLALPLQLPLQPSSKAPHLMGSRIALRFCADFLPISPAGLLEEHLCGQVMTVRCGNRYLFAAVRNIGPSALRFAQHPVCYEEHFCELWESWVDSVVTLTSARRQVPYRHLCLVNTSISQRGHCERDSVDECSQHQLVTNIPSPRLEAIIWIWNELLEFLATVRESCTSREFDCAYSVLKVKNRISLLELGFHFGLHQKTAWILNKIILKVMVRAKGKLHQLGRMQILNTYLTEVDSGAKKKRDVPDNAPSVAFILTTYAGCPLRMKMFTVLCFRKQVGDHGVLGMPVPRGKVETIDLGCRIVRGEVGTFKKVYGNGTGSAAAIIVSRVRIRWGQRNNKKMHFCKSVIVSATTERDHFPKITRFSRCPELMSGCLGVVHNTIVTPEIVSRYAVRYGPRAYEGMHHYSNTASRRGVALVKTCLCARRNTDFTTQISCRTRRVGKPIMHPPTQRVSLTKMRQDKHDH